MWYIALTFAAAFVGWLYDRQMSRETIREMPASIKVVGGIFITEAIRAARILPLASHLDAAFSSLGEAEGVARAGFYALDMLTAYAATGLPMVLGDFRRRRQARARDEAAEDARLEALIAKMEQ